MKLRQLFHVHDWDYTYSDEGWGHYMFRRRCACGATETKFIRWFLHWRKLEKLRSSDRRGTYTYPVPPNPWILAGPAKLVPNHVIYKDT